MASLSSILECLVRYKREIIHYGVALLLMVSALVTGRMAAAVIVFGGAMVMAAFDLWLRPFQIRGEFVFKQREVVHREEIKAIVAEFLARIGRSKSPEKRVPEAEVEETVSPLLEAAGLPPVESPPPLPPEQPKADAEKPPDSVTHST